MSTGKLGGMKDKEKKKDSDRESRQVSEREKKTLCVFLVKKLENCSVTAVSEVKKKLWEKK